MSIIPVQGIWWKKIDSQERLWLGIAIVWALVMFLVMPLGHAIGSHNPSSETYKVTTAEYQAKVDDFTKTYQVGTEKGIPVVAPPPGKDIYLLARVWQWSPVLKLKKGETYRFHISSVDLQHGFSLQPMNMNFMALPGYDYVLTITPTKAGEFYIICNEFCGIGHHNMVGKIIVE